MHAPKAKAVTAFWGVPHTCRRGCLPSNNWWQKPCMSQAKNSWWRAFHICVCCRSHQFSRHVLVLPSIVTKRLSSCWWDARVATAWQPGSTMTVCLYACACVHAYHRQVEW